jgi:hypothetical protein
VTVPSVEGKPFIKDALRCNVGMGACPCCASGPGVAGSAYKALDMAGLLGGLSIRGQGQVGRGRCSATTDLIAFLCTEHHWPLVNTLTHAPLLAGLYVTAATAGLARTASSKATPCGFGRAPAGAAECRHPQVAATAAVNSSFEHCHPPVVL